MGGWHNIERLRLTDRYVLLDMPGGSGKDMVRFGGVVLSDGNGGLGSQRLWLSESGIPTLIERSGFETKRL
jgi:hypothetical protein